MTLILDTSILISVERKDQQTISELKKLSEIYPSPAQITFVNEFEFFLGIKEKNPKNKEKALAFLRNFVVLHTSNQTAAILADLKYKYDKKGLALPIADLLIASLAIEANGILVTRDQDFERIEELRKILI